MGVGQDLELKSSLQAALVWCAVKLLLCGQFLVLDGDLLGCVRCVKPEASVLGIVLGNICVGIHQRPSLEDRSEAA